MSQSCTNALHSGFHCRFPVLTQASQPGRAPAAPARARPRVGVEDPIHHRQIVPANQGSVKYVSLLTGRRSFRGAWRPRTYQSSVLGWLAWMTEAPDRSGVFIAV